MEYPWPWPHLRCSFMTVRLLPDFLPASSHGVACLCPCALVYLSEEQFVARVGYIGESMAAFLDWTWHGSFLQDSVAHAGVLLHLSSAFEFELRVDSFGDVFFHSFML